MGRHSLLFAMLNSFVVSQPSSRAERFITHVAFNPSRLWSLDLLMHSLNMSLQVVFLREGSSTFVAGIVSNLLMNSLLMPFQVIFVGSGITTFSAYIILDLFMNCLYVVFQVAVLCVGRAT